MRIQWQPTVAFLGLAFAAHQPAFGQSDACATPRKYIELVAQGNFDAVAKLFAPDAVIYAPTGAVIHGGDEIAKFYKSAVASNKLVVRGQDFVASGNHCFFEIWSRSKADASGHYVPDPAGEFMRAAADHFTVDDQGRALQMVAFPAPGISTIVAK